MSNTRNKLIDAKRQLTPREEFYETLMDQFQGTPTEVKTCKGRVTRLHNMEQEWERYQIRIDKYIERMHNESGNLPDKIKKAKQTLKEECAHPKEYLEIQEDYFPGSYNDVAYTDYKVKCKLCGKEEIVHTKSHNWYG